MKNKNKYELLKNIDNDDLESNLETTNQIELIDTDKKNLNQNEDCCSICLEQNNITSIELDCGCKNKFHLGCIDELKKHKITKCPLCKKNINRNNNHDIPNNIFFLIYLLIVSIYMISFVSTTIINPVLYIFIPSELKYCDNKYYKCEYYSTKALLSNNTINENLNNFDIKYELLSSYEYLDYKNNQTKTCFNLESHEFITYQEVIKVSKKTIGIEKDIFVPFDNKKSCKLNYKFYNPKKFVLNVLTIINLILMISLLIPITFVNIYIMEYGYIQNLNKYLYGLITIIFFIMILIHFLIQFSYCYYYFSK
jgi:hypothetical protein